MRHGGGGGRFPIVVVEWIRDFPCADLAVDVEEMSAVLGRRVDDDRRQVVES